MRRHLRASDVHSRCRVPAAGIMRCRSSLLESCRLAGQLRTASFLTMSVTVVAVVCFIKHKLHLMYGPCKFYYCLYW